MADGAGKLGNSLAATIPLLFTFHWLKRKDESLKHAPQ